MDPFIHLHVHSQYSLLDGAASLERLVEAASGYGMSALGLTDHGVMHGFVKFVRKAKACGIQPLVGCEMYIAPRSRHDRIPRIDDNPSHLVLFARTEQGFANLIQMLSLAHLEGFYYKPRIDHEMLSRYGTGLVALTACQAGAIPTLLAAGKPDEAESTLRFYQEVMGKEHVYVELQDQNLDGQRELNRQLVELARRVNAPVVATNDVHYIHRTDAFLHDVLLCIQTGSVLSEQNRMRFPNDEFYFKSPQEMAERFREVPEALHNTLKVAGQCEFQPDFGKLRLPEYSPPDGLEKTEYLRFLCQQNLSRRYRPITDEISRRLEYELSVIEQMGYSGYFLVVWDFVRYAKEQGIMVGPGRGSAAGSLVSYLLGITEVDPLRYGLLFERFLNPERVSMPDIDIDFCYERRGEVIEYVRRKYGHDHVAQIIAFGTMAARGAVRDIGRVLGLPYGEVDTVAKKIPPDIGVTLEYALKENPELAALCQQHDRIRQLLDLSRQVEGFPRHATTHAAGVVIAPESLGRLVPLMRSSENDVTTQIPMDDIEALGLLKIDFLGLRTLTVMQNTLKLIGQVHGSVLPLAGIPLDDDATYALLAEARTIGVFQLESSGLRRLMGALKPEFFEDLIALVALYRPGPLGSGTVEDFVRGRHGDKKVEFLHPSLEPILSETYGVIVYQEQVLKISNVMAGFSMAEADILRRAMGKKKPQELARMKEKFLEGAVRQGVERETAQKVFGLMEFFSGYGLNKSHAAPYALIAYQTAYLKAHYPREFMCALISSVMGSPGKVAQYIDECQQMAIPVFPPDINHSGAGFELAGAGIRFGLLAVKNVGRQAIDAIINERLRNGPFMSLYEFCRRLPGSHTNKRMVDSLIRAGAFASTGRSRREMLLVLDDAFELAGGRSHSGQLSFFDVDGGGSLFSSEEKWPGGGEFPQSELLRMEREYMGVFLTGHPLDHWQDQFRKLHVTPLGDLEEFPDGHEMVSGGFVARWKVATTKAGRQMGLLTLEDRTGSVEAILFPDALQRLMRVPAIDDVVLVKGRLERRDEELKMLVSQLKTIGQNKLDK